MTVPTTTDPAPAPTIPLPGPGIAPKPEVEKPAKTFTQDEVNTMMMRERKGNESLKEKADRLDALEAEMGTDKDKAIAAARKEEREKYAAEATPRVVRAEFRAAAKGILSTEQLSALLEDLDLTRYVDANGDVDEARVEKKVSAFAPGKGTTSRDLGQGNRQGVQALPGERGLAEARKRFPTKTA